MMTPMQAMLKIRGYQYTRTCIIIISIPRILSILYFRNQYNLLSILNISINILFIWCLIELYIVARRAAALYALIY